MTDLIELQQLLGYCFHDEALLKQAVTHPSYVAEHPDLQADNQRLEFLGDAVLQLFTTDYLYRRCPELDEGQLTRLRSTLTEESALAGMATRMDLSRFLLLGKGERQSGGALRPSNLADGMEALLGALYLDGGMPAVGAFLGPVILDLNPVPEQLLDVENPKGRLQELAQERFNTTPTYAVLTVTGPDHQPEFEISVSINGRNLGVARAGSRKQAEKDAARLALKQLQDEEVPSP